MSNLFKLFNNIRTTANQATTAISGEKLAQKTSAENVHKENTMATQVILNNGVKIPRIGLGTYGVKEKALCLNLFSEALSSGYRLIDTGTLYGNDEFIGDVVYDKLASRELNRGDVFIETKIAPWQHGRKQTEQAVAESLVRLKLSYLDLVLVHWPGMAKVAPNDPINEKMRAETWQTLEGLVAQGKIKSIGVSNYTQSHLENLLVYAKVKPTLNQAYSSLGSSQSNPPGWTVLFGNETVKSIASKYNRTIPQVLLRWGLQHDCLLIPKTSKVENLKPNMDIFSFNLNEDDMSKLNELNQDKHFCWNPTNIL